MADYKIDVMWKRAEDLLLAGMVRASNAGSQPAGNAVERRRVQHPSVARQLAADARMAAEVSQGLKDAAYSAADSAWK